MLAAGERFVREHGLSLSLEHLSMEDLFREAGVSRTSSYRRWPTKDQFAADLLVRLARTGLGDDLGYLADALADLPADLAAGVGTQDGRHELLVEVLRRSMVGDFAATVDSPRWRAYLTLRAAHVGLPDGALRDDVAEALRETERGFTRVRAVTLAAVAELAGYRLVDPGAFDWEQVSLAVSAVVTGMVVRAYSDPGAVTDTREAAPFGSRRVAEWNPAALASASLILHAIDPDPGVVWDDARRAALAAAVADIPGTLEALWRAAEPGGA